MRHSRSAKQRLWLGPGRYRDRCRHAITNSNPESYANSNGYAFSVWPDGDADAYSNSDGYCYSNCDADSCTNCDADSYSKGNSDTAAPADSASSALRVG